MTTDLTATDQRAIGFWIRVLDAALEDTMARALGGYGLTRVDWQVLTVLRQPRGVGLTLPELEREMGVLADADDVVETVRGLRARGWLGPFSPANPVLAVTESGEGLYRRASSTVAAVRARIVDGIDDDDYDTTMQVLRRMVTNLDEL